MAYDYAEDLAFAQEMIAEYGRAVSLVKLSAPTVDPANPLGGSSVPPLVVSGVMAAFVAPTGLVHLGALKNAKLLKECEQVALVAANGANEFSDFDMMTDDDGSDWKIATVDEFKPGATALLYYIGVNRP